MKKIVMAIGLATLLAGCHTQTYLVSAEQGQAKANDSKMQHFFISGIGQQKTANVAEFCGENKTAKVQTKQTFLNGLIGSVSYGVYTPRNMYFYCK